MLNLFLHHKGNFTTHHHGGQLLFCDLIHLNGIDKFTSSDNGAIVGHLFDLVEFMGDDDDGLALLGEVADNRHQLLDLLGGQNGGGLVQNQNFSAPVESL